MTVHVDNVANTNGWAKAGIMLRADIAGSPTSTGYAVLAVTPTNGVVLQWDSDSDGLLDQAASDRAGVTAPVWLRLTRSGNTVTGQYSTDGSTFTTTGSATLEPAHRHPGRRCLLHVARGRRAGHRDVQPVRRRRLSPSGGPTAGGPPQQGARRQSP